MQWDGWEKNPWSDELIMLAPCYTDIQSLKIEIVYNLVMKCTLAIDQKANCTSLKDQEPVIAQTAFNTLIFFLRKIKNESIAGLPLAIILSLT